MQLSSTLLKCTMKYIWGTDVSIEQTNTNSPFLKKTGLAMAYKNLMPVSNLQFLSKVTEKAVFDQLNSHLAENDLYPLLQCAYRKQHSMETAPFKVVNGILYNMNQRHVTLLVLLDLSAAFDKVDHKILQQRLETSFGITDSAVLWFESYQLDCSHVIIQGAYSNSTEFISQSTAGVLFRAAVVYHIC